MQIEKQNQVNMRAFTWGNMKQWLLSGAIDEHPDSNAI